MKKFIQKTLFAKILILGLLFTFTLSCELDEIINDENDEEGFIDADGNEYETIKIGDQEWMAENLRTTKFNNGDVIPSGFSFAEWSNLDDEAASAIYSYEEIEGFGSDLDVVEAYGKLYNWYAVDDPRGLCPAG